MINMFHAHDYNIEFNDEDSLKFVLKCKCGKIAPDMCYALDDMNKSLNRRAISVIIISAILVTIFICIAISMS